MLVIRPFVTLPARHSAVGVNAISLDSHNYPTIEGQEEYLQHGIVGRLDLLFSCASGGFVCLFVCVNVCDVHFLINARRINLHPTLQTVKSFVMDQLCTLIKFILHS